MRLLPPLYLGYLRFVWRTSRLRDLGIGRLPDICRGRGGAVALIWHDEVLACPWAYPALGLRPHTLASRSRAGEIVTGLLRRAGYVVLRGGSSRGRSRRDAPVIRQMIQRSRQTRPILWGLTVDGSHGPAHRLKRGALVLARESGLPVVLVRTWFRRCIRLPTWDGSALPLPFGEIRYALRGPYHVPATARGREELEALRSRLERDLGEMAIEAFDDFGQRLPESLRARDG